VDLLVLYLWNAAGQVFSIQGTGDSGSALSVTAMAGVELWLCLVVLRSFPAGASLRRAWLLITCAAGARAASGLVAQVLGTNWLLNPLVWTGHAKSVEQIRQAALVASGPIRLALLAAALLAVLRVLKKHGFWARPSATDWATSGVVCLFTLCRFVEAGTSSLMGRKAGLDEWISLAGLPLLCVLFLEAMVLRQSIARMGNGLVTKCWTAFIWGIFLTGAGEVALWVIPHYSQAWPLAMIESLARFPTAAVFALAPAYLVAAQRRAMKPGSGAGEELGEGVAVLAR
jgi:hypothetical protein